MNLTELQINRGYRVKWCEHMKVFEEKEIGTISEWWFCNGVGTSASGWKLCPVCGTPRPTEEKKMEQHELTNKLYMAGCFPDSREHRRADTIIRSYLEEKAREIDKELYSKCSLGGHVSVEEKIMKLLGLKTEKTLEDKFYDQLNDSYAKNARFYAKPMTFEERVKETTRQIIERIEMDHEFVAIFNQSDFNYIYQALTSIAAEKDREIADLQALLTQYREAFSHTHEAGKRFIDKCGKCGLDLRHEIHPKALATGEGEK